jgi:O-antigen/teichoic acid export membrane protein
MEFFAKLLKSARSNYFKEFSVYVLASLMQAAIMFYGTIHFTKVLTLIQFGHYALILTLMTVASSLFSLGMPSALTRYYYEYVDSKKTTVVFTSLVVMSVGFTLLTFVSLGVNIYIFKNLYSHTIIITGVVSSVAYVFFNFGLSILRFQERKREYLIVSIIFSLVYIISLIALSKPEVSFPFTVVILSSGASITLTLYFINRLKLVFDNNQAKQLLGFGLPIAINGALFYLLDWSDRFFVETQLGTEETAVYSLAYKFGSMIQVVFIIPFSLFWSRFRLKYANSSSLAKLTGHALTIYINAGIFMVLAVIIVRPLLELLLGQEYHIGIVLVPLVSFGLIIYGMQNLVDYGLYMNKKLYAYSVVGIIGLILNISLNYLLLAKIGILGAAISTVCTYMLTSLSLWKWSNGFYQIAISKRIIFHMIFGLGIVALDLLVHDYLTRYFQVGVLLTMSFLVYRIYSEGQQILILNAK